MTVFTASYDTETPRCLETCRKIAEVHRRHQMPGTFFITGKTLESAPREYRELLDDPLFEIASHTYSHAILRDQPFGSSVDSLEQAEQEIRRGKQTVEQIFDRECAGLRTPYGFDIGLREAPELLAIIQNAGHAYVSSQAWGPGFSLPAPLSNQPFTYDEDGFDQLWELPCHGWHENVIKGHSKGAIIQRLLAWPIEHPHLIPKGFITSPQQEFELDSLYLEQALASKLPTVSLLWHPWSLGRLDPDAKVLDLLFSKARELDIEMVTCAEAHRRCVASRASSSSTAQPA